MLEYTAKQFLLDQNALILVLCLTAIVVTITKIVIDDPIMAIFSAPIYLISALLSINWFRELGFVASTDKVANLAFASGVGFIVGVMILILGRRLISILTAN